MMVAGEASGDALGGPLMAALRAGGARHIDFFGVGGERMLAEGLEPLFPMSDLSLMGFAEVLPRLPRLLGRLGEAARAASARRPDAVVTIDSPGFNLRLAKRLSGAGIPLIHYVAPQVWAWRPGRARKIAGLLDHLLALLPFEPPHFEAEGLPCTFVGHPAIEAQVERGAGKRFRERHGIAAEAMVLLVLLGSREMEITRHRAAFAAALETLAARFPDLRLVAPTVAAVADAVAAEAEAWPLPALVVRGEAEKLAAFAAAEAALAVSGTVVLELALAGVPTVVAYRTGALNAWIARRLILVEHVSLPNLVLGHRLLPEFLQEACRPQPLAAAIGQILVDPDTRAQQTEGLREVRQRLDPGAPPPSQRAAQAVLDAIDRGPREKPR